MRDSGFSEAVEELVVASPDFVNGVVLLAGVGILRRVVVGKRLAREPRVRVLEAATRSLDQNGSSFPVIYDSS